MTQEQLITRLIAVLSRIIDALIDTSFLLRPQRENLRARFAAYFAQLTASLIAGLTAQAAARPSCDPHRPAPRASQPAFMVRATTSRAPTPRQQHNPTAIPTPEAAPETTPEPTSRPQPDPPTRAPIRVILSAIPTPNRPNFQNPFSLPHPVTPISLRYSNDYACTV